MAISSYISARQGLALSDTAVRRGRPPKDTLKSGRLDEPYELSIFPDAMGWMLAVKLPRVPVGSFKWVQDTPDIYHMARDFLPGSTLTFGYTNALDDGVIILQFRISEYAAKENIGTREATYDELTALLRDYVAKNSGELSAIAKKIRLYVGAE
jgi:hypothetical protein